MFLKKNMRLWQVAVLIILVLPTFFLGGCTSEKGKVPPMPTSSIYVQDYAKVLSEQSKAAILARSTELNAKTNAQIVVVTVPTLGGMDIKEYSIELARKWGIGGKKENNGILILLSLNEKRTRIEVGYGLEGAVNDAKVGAIIREQMNPYLSKGDFDKGILAGYNAVYGLISREYGVAPAANADKSVTGAVKKVTPVNSNSSSGFGSWSTIIIVAIILIIIIIIAIVVFIFNLLRGNRGTHHGYYNSGSSGYSSSNSDSFGGGSFGGGGADSDFGDSGDSGGGDGD